MIRDLKLRNFLAFQEATIQFGGLTVLAGTNSAGKSSVIRALGMLQQSFETGELKDDKWLLNGELVRLGTGRDLLFAEPVAIPGAPSKFASSVELTDESKHGSEWIADAQMDADALPVVAGSRSGTLSRFWNGGFQYLSADRAAPETTYPKSHTTVSSNRSLGARGEHTANFLRVFGGTPVANSRGIADENAGNSYLAQTKVWLDRLSPGSSIEVGDIPGTELVTLRYPRLGEVWLPAHRATNVGYGMTVALPLIVGAMAAGPGSLLVVENPEIHLHPAGQSMIASLLAAAVAGGAQVVLETHSDHVLNGLRLAVRRGKLAPHELVVNFFSRSPGELAPNIETLDIDERGVIEKWPPGFFDQMDHDLAELIS